MSTSAEHLHLEEEITRWREYLRRGRAINAPDMAELEDHLRDEVGELRDKGLSSDEAFLIAVKRLGSLDALSLEFGREHSDRLWKQLVMAPADDAGRAPGEFWVVVLLAIVAALAIK